jgi:hypothetical protein
VIINTSNEVAFNGNGECLVSQSELNLYESGTNQLVKSYGYSTGNLTIDWRYKYYQKEIVHSKQYNNVRNLSPLNNKKIGKFLLLEEGLCIIEEHKQMLNHILKS